MKKLILSVLAIAAMTSCTKSSVEDFDSNNPMEIKFGAGINMMSRAIINSDENNLPIAAITGIQILRGTDGTDPKFNEVSAVATTATMGTDGIFTGLSSTQYYTSATAAANFIAYYPAGTLAAGKVSFTIDGKTDDIIVAPKATTTFATPLTPVSFSFEHKLAQLKLVIKATDQTAIDFYGNLTAATINVPSKLDMTIAADGSSELAANGTPTNIDLDFGGITLETTENPAANNFIILPIAPTKIKLTFANVTEKEYDITGLALEAGKITTLTVTVNATGVSFKSTISKWVDGGTNGSTTVGGN